MLPPNRKWATDITEFSICGQKMYLSPIIDFYNSEVVSYTLSLRPDLAMVTSMLYKALRGVDRDNDLIIHSDQGWHYQHYTYQKILKDKGVM
jgi:transposase InsO family protein